MKIPKRAFQAIVILLLVPAFGFMLYDFVGNNGLFALVSGAAGSGSVGKLAGFIVTLFAYFIPWVAVALLLRRFSAMPTFSQELSGMEGAGVFEKMRNSYQKEARQLEEWKRQGNARYARRMAIGGFSVFAASSIAIAAVVLLLGWDALLTVADFKIGLALLLAPPVSLVLGIYYGVKGWGRK